MAKYIDAEKLIMEIKFAKSVYDNPKRVVLGVADAYRQDGRAAMCDDILKRIDSLQQEQPSFPSNLDEAAEVYASDYPAYNDEQVIAKYAFKRGAEWRDAQIQKLPEGLDEAANNYGIDIRLGYPRVMDETDKFIYNAFRAGAGWMAGQGETIDGQVAAIAENRWVDLDDSTLDKQLASFKDGDEVIVQIRKK